jgi:hypothetical protein
MTWRALSISPYLRQNDTVWFPVSVKSSRFIFFRYKQKPSSRASQIDTSRDSDEH